MLSRYWLLGLVGLMLAAVLVSFSIRKVSLEKQLAKEAQSSGASPSVAAPRPQIDPATVEPKINPAELNEAEFKKWLTVESKSLESTNVDGDRKQIELRKTVERMTPSQKNLLAKTAGNPKAHPAEKILSAYMLVEGGINTRQELAALIAAPMEDYGTPEPHSQAEIFDAREKSLRIMAIDGLFSQAKTDPAAKADLAKTVDDIQDPYVRDYARQRLEELERQ
jgi:hypothetical protein